MTETPAVIEQTTSSRRRRLVSFVAFTLGEMSFLTQMQPNGAPSECYIDCVDYFQLMFHISKN